MSKNEVVVTSFRLTKPKSKNIHPMTISNDFVTLFAFHNATVEKLIKGKRHTSEERYPIIIIWDGKALMYQKAERGDKVTINKQEYLIDRDVDDVFPYLPSEEFVFEMCAPGFKKKLKDFEAKDLFKAVLDYYEYYFFMESRMLYRLVSLYSINQCVFDAYASTPYLHISSPLEECGKTNLAKSIQQMWNGIISTNLDAHHVYRMVHGCSPTFIFDESKGWDRKYSNDPRMRDLLRLLNSGYQRGVPVYRFRDNSGKGGFGNMKPEAFEGYGPKVIVTTEGSLPRDLQSRCAEIMMQRAPKDEKSTDYADRWSRTKKGSTIPDREIKLAKIRRMAVMFRLKYGMEIKAVAENENWRSELDHTEAFKGLRNRHLEIFKPLVILTLKYMPEWADIVAKYINEYKDMKEKITYSKQVTILFALRKIYQLCLENGGSYAPVDLYPVKIEIMDKDGEVMWVSASHISAVIIDYQLGNIEEFGRFPESVIGRMMKDFGFIETQRTSAGNVKKIKTSRLAERLRNYAGLRLMDELSLQERMEILARHIRNMKEITLEELYDAASGKMTQEQVTAGVKHLRTNGVVMSSGKDGKGVITWLG